MIKLADFFGLSIDEENSDCSRLLAELKIDEMIEKTKVVSTLKKQNGKDAPIVSVGRRQQILKHLKPLINEDMLEHDDGYYSKEVNTSSEHDRRYGAEDKLLEFALLVASTKSIKVANEDPAIPTVKQMREAAFKGTRYDRYWDLLSDETNHVIEAYRKSK